MARARPPDSQHTNHTAFLPHDHDHGRCREAALVRAEAIFADRQIRMTDLRRSVLEEIVTSHEAVGAYDLIDRMARKGRRLAPISIYRAIDALVEAGVVHRLESRNAFFACHGNAAMHEACVFLICDQCGCVGEAGSPEALDAIGKVAAATGFTRRRALIEVVGRCADCAEKSSPSP